MKQTSCAMILGLVFGVSILTQVSYAETCPPSRVDDQTGTTGTAVDKKEGDVAATCENGKRYVARSEATTHTCTPLSVAVTWQANIPDNEKTDPEALKKYPPEALFQFPGDTKLTTIGSCLQGGSLAQAIEAHPATRGAQKHISQLSALDEKNGTKYAYEMIKQDSQRLTEQMNAHFDGTTGTTDQQMKATREEASPLAALAEMKASAKAEPALKPSGLLGSPAIEGLEGDIERLASEFGSSASADEAISGGSGIDSYRSYNGSGNEDTFGANKKELAAEDTNPPWYTMKRNNETAGEWLRRVTDETSTMVGRATEWASAITGKAWDTVSSLWSNEEPLTVTPAETTSPDFSDPEIWAGESVMGETYPDVDPLPVVRDADTSPAMILPPAAQNAPNLTEFYVGVGEKLPSFDKRAELATSLGLNGDEYEGDIRHNRILLCYLKGGTRLACGAF